jgi:hypothetical protein
VSERTVAQILFVCQDCGYLLEAQRSEICPSCGSMAGEFAIFAPFFSGTPEHIARRAPSDALYQLHGDGARLVTALVGDDATLTHKPGDDEWCAKEIAGHMVDIVELAVRRVRPVLDAAYSPPPERTMLPWRLLDTEGYAGMTATAITERFDAALADLCRIFDDLRPDEWRKKVDLVSGRTLVVDVSSWVANHNIAHLRQIDALLRH